MHMRFRMPSAGTLIACVALFAALGGSAVAASVLTGANIKNNSLTGKDVKPGSVGLARLTKGTQALIKSGGNVGASSTAATGVTGATGAQGPAGANGANGAQGPKGDKGAQGDKGADALTKVTALPQSGWDKRTGTCDGTPGAPVGAVAIAAGHGQLAFTDGNQYGGLTYDTQGAKLGDLAYFAYSTHYTQDGADQHGAAPYLIIKTNDGTPSPGGDHSVIFSPNTQAGRIVTEGLWQRWSATEGSGRYDDDGGNNPDVSWESIVAAHGDQTITRLSLQGGCAGAYSDGTVADVDNIEMDLAGNRKVFDLG
jgi:hypothetical protein